MVPMTSIRLSAVIPLLALLLGCAANEAHLSDRGLTPKDRTEYLDQKGFGLPKNVQNDFLEGRVAPGMTRDMVLHLFGPPDRTAETDQVWEYVDAKGRDVTGMRFKGDKLIEVYGDPAGRISAGKASH